MIDLTPLPCDPAAEQAVLGRMMLYGEDLADGCRLNPDVFSIPANRTLFLAICDLHAEGKHPDLVVLPDYLQQHGLMEAVGGLLHVIEVEGTGAGMAGFEAHRDILLRMAAVRSVLTACAHIENKARSWTEDGPALFAEALAVLGREAEGVEHPAFRSAAEIVNAEYDAIEEEDAKGLASPGITTGIVGLDKLLAGLQNGDLIVVGGRPSQGKTCLALQFVDYATSQGHPVGFISYEMKAGALMRRLLATHSGIDASLLRLGKVGESEWTQLQAAGTELYERKLYFCDKGNLQVRDLRGICRDAKRRFGIEMVVVDYLELVRSDRAESERLRITGLIQGFKDLAMELNLPVVVLSQLSRMVEQRADKRPELSDLKESGAIEAAADVVVFLYHPKGKPNICELIIAKQRNGPVGTVETYWRREAQRFENLADERKGRYEPASD